jgi:hypothetical protein
MTRAVDHYGNECSGEIVSSRLKNPCYGVLNENFLIRIRLLCWTARNVLDSEALLLWLCNCHRPNSGHCPRAPITVHPEPTFSVDGLAVGAPVAPNSIAYHRYDCKPSEQYARFTRCHESHNENGVRISRTILHASNLITWYVNKELSPVYFSSSDIDTDINQLSSRFGRTQQVYRLNQTRGYPKAIIVTFGGVKLEPLKPDDLAILARGKSPHIGILVDFLNDFHRSAKDNLPVYKLGGSEGFAWIATYDQEGKGTLRLFAADASQMKLGKAGTSESAPSSPEHSSETPAAPDAGSQQSSPPTMDKESAPFRVAMDNVHGVYVVPIRINDTITLNAILDSGAS